MEYHFNKEIAVTYGLDEAIFIHNLVHWVEKNKINKKHFHFGTYWTYNSISAFCELFPFWSKKQIERILKSLIESDGVISSSINKKGYDRTKWYAIVDESIFLAYSLKKEEYWPTAISPNGEMEFSKTGNPFLQTGTPIPYSNTDSKNTDIEGDELKNSSAELDFNLPINKKNKKEKRAPNPLFVACKDFWLTEVHPDWTFGAVQGINLKYIIDKLRILILKKRDTCNDDDILQLFKVMCIGLPDYFKNKDIQVINSKFNEIVTELQERKNARPKYTKGESIFRS